MAVKTYNCPVGSCVTGMTAEGGEATECIAKASGGVPVKLETSETTEVPDRTKLLKATASGQKAKGFFDVITNGCKAAVVAGGKVVGITLHVNAENQSTVGANLKIQILEPAAEAVISEPSWPKGAGTAVWKHIATAASLATLEAMTPKNLEELAYQVERLTAKEPWIFQVYVSIEVNEPGSSFSRSTTDTVSVSESISRVLGLVRTPSDAVGVAESVQRTVSFARSATDTVSIAESVERSRGVTRETTDSVGVTEATSRTLGLVRAVSDSVGISEVVSRLAGLVRPTSDTIGVAEVISRGVGRTRATSDTITISEAVSRTAGLVRSTSDTVSPAGVVSRVLHFLRSAADSISIVEAIRVEHHGAAPFAFFARWVDEAELAGGWRRTAALPARFVVGQVLRVKQEVVRP